MNASGGGGGGGNKQSSAPSSLRFFLGDRLVFTAGHNAPLPPPFLPRSPPHEGTISRIIASPPLPERHRRRSFRRKRSSLPFFANRNGNENETTTKTTTEKKKKKLTEIGIEELARIALRLAARAYLIQ